MRYVPIYVEVDTDSDHEAVDCAHAVADHVKGESFKLVFPGGIDAVCDNEGDAIRAVSA